MDSSKGILCTNISISVNGFVEGTFKYYIYIFSNTNYYYSLSVLRDTIFQVEFI